jgi:hypothetical protein
MLYAKPWEHPNAVATLSIIILLSARINSSTRCTVASVAISTGRFGRALFATQKSLREFLDSVANSFTRQTLPTVNSKHLFMNIFLCWVLLPTQKHTTGRCCYTPEALSPFLLLKPVSEYVHSRLVPRLSWSWTVLLPSDTHIKPITTITAVLLPFLTYLLTLPRTCTAAQKFLACQEYEGSLPSSQEPACPKPHKS